MKKYELYEKKESLQKENNQLQYLSDRKGKDILLLLKIYLEEVYGINFKDPKNDWGVPM